MKLFIFAALSIAGFQAAHALDLTPITSYRDLEGVKVPVISFEDGSRKVNWQPPDNWQLSGGSKLLNLSPGKISLASVQLKLIAPEAARTPDHTGSNDAILKWAKSYVPADSSELVFGTETASPFMLGEKQSREFTFSYVFAAKKCITTVALVDLDLQQSLALVVTARAEDFDAIHDDVTRSMFRWRWLSKTITGQEVTASNTSASQALR